MTDNTTPTPQTFHVGQRVELHPVMDAWVSGDRFGTVAVLGRKYVHVAMDRSGKVRKVHPRNLLPADSVLYSPAPREYRGLWRMRLRTRDGRSYRGTGRPYVECSPMSWDEGMAWVHSMLDMDPNLTYAGARETGTE